MEESIRTKPDLKGPGLSWGMAFDGEEAWRLCVRSAYAPGYFWVCLQSGKRLTRTSPPFATFTFHCPVARADVMAVAAALIPQATDLKVEDLKWSNPMDTAPQLGMPWVVPQKYGWTGERLLTFFGLSEERKTIRVGSTAAPAQRCGKEELLLLGVCALSKESARAKMNQFTTERSGWFRADEKAFSAVAKLCSAYACEELLK